VGAARAVTVGAGEAGAPFGMGEAAGA
jgi:hypothetical protein